MPRESIIYNCDICGCGYSTYADAELCENKKLDCTEVFESGHLLPKVNICSLGLNNDVNSPISKIAEGDKQACLMEIIDRKVVSNIDTNMHSVMYLAKGVAPIELQEAHFLIVEFGLGSYIPLDLPSTDPVEIERFFENLMYLS